MKFTEAGRTLAVAAGVAASAIRKDVGALEPAGPDELMRVAYGRHTLHNERLLERVGITRVPTGSGFISGPFRRRLRNAFWS